MNIIFGDAVDQLATTHTVLELDTFRLMPSQQLIKTFCVIETIPLAEFPLVENNKHIHQQLIENYRQQNWQYCQGAVKSLIGCWNGEMDSFYQHLAERIDEYIHTPPGADWDFALVKHEAID